MGEMLKAYCHTFVPPILSLLKENNIAIQRSSVVDTKIIITSFLKTDTTWVALHAKSIVSSLSFDDHILQSHICLSQFHPFSISVPASLSEMCWSLDFSSAAECQAGSSASDLPINSCYLWEVRENSANIPSPFLRLALSFSLPFPQFVKSSFYFSRVKLSTAVGGTRSSQKKQRATVMDSFIKTIILQAFKFPPDQGHVEADIIN